MQVTICVGANLQAKILSLNYDCSKCFFLLLYISCNFYWLCLSLRLIKLVSLHCYIMSVTRHYGNNLMVYMMYLHFNCPRLDTNKFQTNETENSGSLIRFLFYVSHGTDCVCNRKWKISPENRRKQQNNDKRFISFWVNKLTLWACIQFMNWLQEKRACPLMTPTRINHVLVGCFRFG